MNAMFWGDYEPSSADIKQSCTYGSNVTVGLVLLASTRDGHEEYKDPRDADLCPHFEANAANARV